MSLENINKNKIHKVSFLIICIVQIFFTYNSIMFDYYNDYNGTNKLVSFLDEINFDYENETLSGLLYHVVGIQSKFDKNIFANYGKNSDKAFYKWTIDRDYDETTNNSYDAYVMTAMGKDTEDSIHLTSSTTKNVVKELIYKNYVCYKFNGYVYSKNMIKEINSYLLFLSPQINSRVDNSKYTPFEIPKSYFNY